ncbi:MAG: hypothetical protein R2792_00290 [Saprospiraceae bacterium]
MKTRSILAVFSLFLFGAGTATAQVFTPYFENAAALALGGALVAAPNADHGVYNSALPAQDQTLSFLAGAVLPYGISGWQSYQIQAWAPAGPLGGLLFDAQQNGTESYTEQRFSGGYSRKLSDRFMLGADVHFLRLSQQEYGSANGVSAGISVLSNPVPTLWLGASVAHPFGLELAGNRLPARLRIGAAWAYGSNMLLLAEVDKDLDRRAQVKAGLEYAPVTPVRIRIGMRSEPARPSFGLGFQLKNGIHLDAGADWHSTLGVTSGLTLSWRKPSGD